MKAKVLKRRDTDCVLNYIPNNTVVSKLLINQISFWTGMGYSFELVPGLRSYLLCWVAVLTVLGYSDSVGSGLCDRFTALFALCLVSLQVNH